MTPKQRRFVAEYVVDLNATQGAIRAGYSPKGADREGARLLRKPDVAAAVQAALDERSERTRIKADRVVAELAAIAFARVSDVVSWSASGVVTVKPADMLTEPQRAAIAEVQDVAGANGRSLKVKMHDKLAALTALGRHLGMFVDRHEVSAAAGESVKVNFVIGTPADYDLYREWLERLSPEERAANMARLKSAEHARLSRA